MVGLSAPPLEARVFVLGLRRERIGRLRGMYVPVEG